MKLFFSFLAAFTILACTPQDNTSEKIEAPVIVQNKSAHEHFNDYWYSNGAEITSYDLEQSRYGEIHKGHAVLITVPEQFLTNSQVKADSYSKEHIDILKLNLTKKFNTGIYPYSVMTSSFTPIKLDQSLKVSSSIQEWCGHSYMQLNNQNGLHIKSHSYFEKFADLNFQISEALLEDDLWNNLRIDPLHIKTGKLQMIPSLEFFNLYHKKVKVYEVSVTQELTDDFITTNLYYPTINRNLKITQINQPPYIIDSWEEKTGNHPNNITKATRKVTEKIPYWNTNKPKDSLLRKQLKIK